MAWQPDYASLAEARAFLRITDVTFTEHDTLIALAITAASRDIDGHCHRQFGLGAQATRYYTAHLRWAASDYIADIDDLSAATSLVVTSTPTGGSGTALTDYVLWPRNAILNGKPYTTIIMPTAPTTDEHGLSLASAYFGWAAVPSAVKTATLLQTARIVKRQDAPFGIAGSPDVGAQLRLLAKLDPDVVALLRPYVRHWA